MTVLSSHQQMNGSLPCRNSPHSTSNAVLELVHGSIKFLPNHSKFSNHLLTSNYIGASQHYFHLSTMHFFTNHALKHKNHACICTCEWAKRWARWMRHTRFFLHNIPKVLNDTFPWLLPSYDNDICRHWLSLCNPLHMTTRGQEGIHM